MLLKKNAIRFTISGSCKLELVVDLRRYSNNMVVTYTVDSEVATGGY